ncbi:MAG: SEC-C domain-containing protein [Candidatus Acidiferrales bacterium]
MLAFRIDGETQLVLLEGSLAIRSDCGISTSIETKLIFPRNYPEVEPRVFDATQRFKPYPGKTIEDRHLYSTGQCCLWLPPQTPWRSSNPYALRDLLDQVVVFFDRQLIYDDTGVWPGPAYAHGEQGYRQFIQEELQNDPDLTDALTPVILRKVLVGRNESCPCGGILKFKKCHLRIVEEIQLRIALR